MPDLDFENVDTVKAFFSILLGGVLAAILLYIYFRTVRPSLVSALGVGMPVAATTTTTTAAGA